MKLSLSQAQSITWCHVYDGKVHAADWHPSGGGGLTTLIEDEDDEDRYVCDQQSDAPIEKLRTGQIKPWRDRRSFGLPVCTYCEDDVAFVEDLRDIARNL